MEANKQNSDSVISYVLSIQENLKEMSELVQKNFTKAQGKKKHGYGKNAYKLEVGTLFTLNSFSMYTLNALLHFKRSCMSAR